MPPEFDARTKELISRMWGRKLWVVMSKGSGAEASFRTSPSTSTT